MINNEPKELTIIYHSEKADDKKARGYAEPLDKYVIKWIDLAHDNITETQLAEVSNMMNCEISDLMDITFSDGKKEVREQLKSMGKEDTLKMLVKNKLLIKTPIVVIGSRAYYYGSGYYLIKEGMVNTEIKSERANIDEINR